MANINLLPWRDELRAEKQKQFYSVLGLVALLAGVTAFAWISVVNAKIESQSVRNDLLQREIAQLKKQVDEIRNLRKQRQQLVDRMEVIQSLQGNRPQIVHVFDDLVHKVPDGVYLTELSRSGQQITVSGIAESNNRVSSLMRQLDESDWFTGPNLRSVTKTSGGRGSDNDPNRFNMTVRVSNPKPNSNSEG